jgi:hypothetical protein
MCIKNVSKITIKRRKNNPKNKLSRILNKTLSNHRNPKMNLRKFKRIHLETNNQVKNNHKSSMNHNNKKRSLK